MGDKPLDLSLQAKRAKMKVLIPNNTFVLGTFHNRSQ